MPTRLRHLKSRRSAKAPRLILAALLLLAFTPAVAAGSPRDVTYQLTVTTAGSGSVWSVPAGIECGSVCTYAFPYGQVQLFDAPFAGWKFVGWSGACSGSGTWCMVPLTSATAVSATFARKPQRHLAVVKRGSGSGKVISTPAGIRCGSKCSAAFDNSTAVTLMAKAAKGSRFTGWSGVCAGRGSCTVVLIKPQRVIATFKRG
jgi:hypothetical protein